jgi:hypothetical protein
VENCLSEYVETTPNVLSIFDKPDIFPRSVEAHLISQNLKDPDHPPLISLAPINPVYSDG